MPRNEQPKSASQTDFELVALALSYLSGEYEKLAKAMEAEKKFSRLTVRNWKTMEKALLDIQRAVAKAYEAFGEAQLGHSLGRGDEQPVDRDADHAAEIMKNKAIREAKARKRQPASRKSHEP